MAFDAVLDKLQKTGQPDGDVADDLSPTPIGSAAVPAATERLVHYPIGGGFSPVSLFAAGAQGVWFDPSDMSSMFQDAGGVTPVTAVGQPVGKILDRSGRGNHATQAAAGRRPILQQDAGGRRYLAFDGFDDSLATGNINLTATDAVTLWAGVLKASDAAVGNVCEFTVDPNTNNGSFGLAAPSIAATPNYSFRTKGTATLASVNAITYAAPHTAVLIGIYDNSGAPPVLGAVNGVLVTGGTTSPGNYANAPLYIGSRGDASNRLNGRLYGLIILDHGATEQEIVDAEFYMMAKTGVFY